LQVLATSLAAAIKSARQRNRALREAGERGYVTADMSPR